MRQGIVLWHTENSKTLFSHTLTCSVLTYSVCTYSAHALSAHTLWEYSSHTLNTLTEYSQWDRVLCLNTHRSQILYLHILWQTLSSQTLSAHSLHILWILWQSMTMRQSIASLTHSESKYSVFTYPDILCLDLLCLHVLCTCSVFTYSVFTYSVRVLFTYSQYAHRVFTMRQSIVL